MAEITIKLDGREIQIEESELPKNFFACTEGEKWCKDHIQYQCNGKGEWIKIGQC